MIEIKNITDCEGMRLRILPTNFTTVQTRLKREPSEVVYADVTVLSAASELELGNTPIYNRVLVAQIKNAWVGRPIVGTLRHREDSRWPGARIYYLDDLEVL